MRSRILALIAALTIPVAVLSAQGGVRLPRGGVGRGGTGTTTEQPTPLPPAAPVVNQALAYNRSRWSGETYSMINAAVVPSMTGAGTLRYTTAGAGTHAEYRVTDHVATTLDLASTLPIGTSNSQTFELGTRYSPLDWSHRVRPFVDARADYTRMTDTFTGQAGTVGLLPLGGSNDDVIAGSRYSRGVGAVGGMGAEYSLTSRFALTTELAAVRNRMSTYQIAGLGSGQTPAFWMTSYRFLLGLKFNPASTLHMAQKAAP
ncbi:MAG TPA: hypothetical protein VHV78_05040 [Gemmatimonadaceae bacterium]|jgi:hypothetical protein|nr:hypothetical protein [Gemmatimonadaceae bacterium]